LNAVTTNTYDAAGNQLSTTNALGKTTSFSYDPRGLLLTITDARGKVTSFAYDSSGNLTDKTDALNHVTQFAYDARSRLTSVTNSLGHVTAFAYDGAGRLTQVTQPDGTNIKSEYDLGGRRTATIDAKGNRSTYAYDGANRLTSETDALGQATSYAYDSLSNLITRTDALGRVTDYEYDDFNRLVKIIYPPASVGETRLFETLAYDAVGNVRQRTDTAGRTTIYGYTNESRLDHTTDAAGQLTLFNYDAVGRLIAVIDAQGQRYRFNYDAASHLRQVRRGTAVMSFTYDAAGNRKHRTDYNGVLTSYDYDALNRLKTINYPDATTVNYTYDKLSRLQTATNVHGTVDFDYNKMNQLTSVTDVFAEVINYHYDDNGNRTKLLLNGATSATYRYDAGDRLTKIIDPGGVSTNFTYDVTDKLLSRRLPNGVVTTYTHDDLDRLTRLRDAKGAATVADHQYQYDTASQLTRITEPGNTRSYVYDAIDRLTSANYTNPAQPNENYAYDGVGNRTSSHLSANYGYQPFNRLTNSTAVSYSYDANGNLISKTDALGTWIYSWDFENRLIQVLKPDSSSVIYRYDALGRRIQRAPSAGVSTNFVYDGQDVIKDFNSDGSTVDYLNGPGIDNKLRLTDSRVATGPLYFLQDQLGSTTALTNSSGGIVERVTYDAYGNSSGSSFTRYDYTGRERDPDTGLLYYRARWYDPEVGRFISEDPAEFAGGLNWYAYVNGNPVNLTDPYGLWETAAHDEIIDQALMHCLDKSQRDQLKHASRWVDRPSNQFAATAYQHGMRAPWESVATASRAAYMFIWDHQRAARNAFPRGCQSGSDKLPWNALWEFGKALHTLTDMTSPSHAGFQVWHDPLPPPLLGAWGIFAGNHHRKETLGELTRDPTRLEMIKRMVRDEFAKTFGDCGCC
jgi:RHS repeat-associated protein